MLYNMYLFNAGLNKYEYVKHCIIVANTYGHGVIFVVVVIVLLLSDAASCGSHAPKAQLMTPCACVGVPASCPPGIMHLTPTLRMRKGASGRMTVICGCGTSASGIPEAGNSISRSPALIPLSALEVTAT